MAMPKPKYSYEMALGQLPKGFSYLCSGCKETFTVYPKGQPFTYSCWCGSTKSFTGKETKDAAV